MCSRFNILLLIIFSIILVGCDNNEISIGVEKNEEYPIPLPLPVPDLNLESNYYTLFRDCEIEDKTNNRSWKYNVILPPSYQDNLNSVFPVLFLLHGKDGNRNSWFGPISILEMVDYCHEKLGMPEIVIIMPDAENTYYIDGFQDGIMYESFFFNEFIPEMENIYRISLEKEKRMIGGFSMGGYGAVYYALKYSKMFGLCHAMNCPVDGKGSSSQQMSLIPLFQETEGNQMPYFILDIGTQDSFAQANKQCHLILELLGIDHYFITREGAHNAQFWKESLYILFNHLSSFIV